MKPWERYAQPQTEAAPWKRYQAPEQVAAPEQAKPEPQEGIWRTILDQGLQGSSFGFADELTDRGGAAIASLFTDESYDDLLKEARAESQARMQRQFEQNPGTSILSNIGGAVLTGGAAGTTKAGAPILNSLRTGNLPARILKGAAAGAASGGAYGAGSAQDGERTEGAKRGAILGAAFGGAAPVAGRVVNKLDKSLGKKIIPTADKLRQQASKLYTFADKKGGVLKPQVGNTFIDEINKMRPKTDWGTKAFGDDETSVLIRKISGNRNKPMSLQAAQELDEGLGNLIDKFTENGQLKKEGKRLLDIQNMLRDSIEKADESMVIGGKEGFNALKDARKAWSTSRKLADIERIIDNAQYMQVPATGIKTGFRTLLRNKSRMRGFSTAERKAIEKAAKTGIVTDVLNVAGSRLGPMMTGVGVGVGTGNPIVGLGAALASQAGSSIARKGAYAIQSGKAQKALEKVALQGADAQYIPLSQLTKEQVKKLMQMKPRDAQRALISQTPQDIRITDPSRLLPAPVSEYAVTSSGQAFKRAGGDVAASEIARQQARALGLTPDIQRAIYRDQIRKKYSDVWDKLDAARKAKIDAEADMMWQANKVPIEEMVKAAEKNIKSAGRITGRDTDNAFTEAFKKALQKKK